MREARQRHLKVMIGSMVATSLAVAPAMLLASQADWIDLDGPLLLAHDSRKIPWRDAFCAVVDLDRRGGWLSHQDLSGLNYLYE